MDVEVSCVSHDGFCRDEHGIGVLARTLPRPRQTNCDAPFHAAGTSRNRISRDAPQMLQTVRPALASIGAAA